VVHEAGVKRVKRVNGEGGWGLRNVGRFKKLVVSQKGKTVAADIISHHRQECERGSGQREECRRIGAEGGGKNRLGRL